MCVFLFSRYMPPERMDSGRLGPEGDVWVAGMMVAGLIAKRVPFCVMRQSCEAVVTTENTRKKAQDEAQESLNLAFSNRYRSSRNHAKSDTEV